MTFRHLRHRITFQTDEQTPDGSGGFHAVWRDVATVWAAMMPVAASQVSEARQLRQQRQWEIRVRFNRALTDCRRLRHGTSLYRVQAVRDPDGNGRWLLIRAEEQEHD